MTDDEKREWIASLQPGDVVAFTVRTFGPEEYEFKEIAKISPNRAKFTLDNGDTKTARDARWEFHQPTEDMRIANKYARDLRMVRGFDWTKPESRELVLQVAELIRAANERAVKP